MSLVVVIASIAMWSRLDAQTIYNVPPDPAPTSVTGDTIVNLLSGGVLGNNFQLGTGAELNVQGGTAGWYLRANASTVNVDAGVIGPGMLAQSAATVNVFGGRIDNSLRIYSGSVVNVEGGIVGHFVEIYDDSVLNIRGGVVGIALEAHGTSVINLEGGELEGAAELFDQATINISGGLMNEVGGIGPGLGLFANAGTTVNISGGSVSELDIASNVAVDMSGGTLFALTVPSSSVFDFSGGRFNSTIVSNLDGLVTMTGGVAHGAATINNGGRLELSGGALADGLRANAGSQLEINGFDFRLNNQPIPGLNIAGDMAPFVMPSSGILSGVIADGSPFVFTPAENDILATTASITLTRSATLPIEPLIEVSTASTRQGVREGETLHLLNGGTLPNHVSAIQGSTVHVEGGTMGSNFEALGADVHMSAGQIGNSADAFADSNFAITGGTLGSGFQAHDGSHVTIEGGRIESSSASRFEARSGSTVVLGGGTYGDWLSVNAAADFTIEAADVSLNGAPIAGLDDVSDSVAISVPNGSVLSGTFADGTPFAFQPGIQETFLSVVNLRRTAAPPIGPAQINVPSDAPPPGIRAGQTLVVHPLGLVPTNFNAGQGSRVDVMGGTIQGNFEAVGAEVNLSGGTIGGLDALLGTNVHVDGGTLTGINMLASELEIVTGRIDSLTARYGSRVDMHAGRLGTATAESGSVLNILGGQVGNFLTARNGGVINIHGGTIGETSRGGATAVVVESGGAVHMTGGTVAVYPFNARLGSVVTISSASSKTRSAFLMPTSRLAAAR